MVKKSNYFTFYIFCSFTLLVCGGKEYFAKRNQ